jgi:hypothetical protein
MDKLKTDPMYRFLILLTISSAVGLQSWHTLFNNFAVEIAGLKGHHIGVIQSIREIPGFLTLLVIYVLLVMKEYRLSALSILTLGLGVAITGIFPSFIGLIVTTLAMSFGFHYYETTNRSLTLQYFDIKISPYVFGKQRSYAAATNVGVGLFIYAMSSLLSFTQLYLILGGVVIAAGLWGLAQNPSRVDIVLQHKRMIFRQKYWLYYFLTFMAGARRQIFMAFSVLLLVERLHFTIQEISILFVINNSINYFLSPMIGRSIIRFGERRILSLEYFSLIFIFMAYATTQSKWLLAGLYILDHIFFNFSIAIRTYFQKVGDPQDIAPSMAVGFTINHIAAVILPVVGGFLWLVDYRIPFMAGAGMSLISFLAVQMIRV